MEQKQLKMWLPSFLTWRAERVLQKQAEMGYLLIAVENFGSFYTFSFECAAIAAAVLCIPTGRYRKVGRTRKISERNRRGGDQPLLCRDLRMQRQLLLCGGNTAGCTG